MINLDKNVSDRLNEGMNLGGGIQLPFLAPVFFVVNGDPKLKSLGGAQFYGGWAGRAEDIQEAEDAGLSLPASFVLTEMTTGDGKGYDAYLTRSVVVAPIAVRQAWITREKVRSPHYVEGARQHVQALCYMAIKTDANSAYTPWGPVILSAKGFQAKNLLGAFGAWDKFTASQRRKVAPGVPAWCFYLAIGTFGKDRQQVMVGSSSQSPITPIGAYLPEGLTEDTLTKLFVGQQTAEAMADYLQGAVDWLSAWKDSSKDQLGGQPVDGEFVPEAPGEDIPF
jgi:hypothetical protein